MFDRKSKIVLLQYNKGVFPYTERKTVKEVSDLIDCDTLGGTEPIISVGSVNHAENVESVATPGWYMGVLMGELPAVRHVSLSADMALITVIKVYEPVSCLFFEFFAASRSYTHRAAARVAPWDVFLYVYISRQCG